VEKHQSRKVKAYISVDVEDWFHILDSDATPDLSSWGQMESRVEKNLERLFDLFNQRQAKVTFFWLGWMAERYPELLLRCKQEGHETASHGFAHLLPFRVGRVAFRGDLRKSIDVIESITNDPVHGFRAPGFGIMNDHDWAFDEIKDAGFLYDSSIFPSRRGHGGYRGANPAPHMMNTKRGPIVELPVSVVDVAGARLSMFGGGYLRLFPLSVIRMGLRHLERRGRPLIVYMHPRDIDPEQPRLNLGLLRNFKSYVNLGTTFDKLDWICKNHQVRTLKDLAMSVSPDTGELHETGGATMQGKRDSQ